MTTPLRSASGAAGTSGYDGFSEEHWAYDAPSGDYLHVSQDDGGLCFVVGTAGSSEVSSHGVYVPTPVLRSLMRWIGTRS